MTLVLVILSLLVLVLGAATIIRNRRINFMAEVLDRLYGEVAEDRHELYKRLERAHQYQDDLDLKLKLLAERLNSLEETTKCLCNGTCEKCVEIKAELKKEITTTKPETKAKRPRTPKK